MKQYYVYILASKRNGTLYVGISSELKKRVWEHKQNLVSSFTRKYRVHRLVFYEAIMNVHSAIQFEKRLKRWRRKWKLQLIEEMNPEWKDLYDDI